MVRIVPGDARIYCAVLGPLQGPGERRVFGQALGSGRAVLASIVGLDSVVGPAHARVLADYHNSLPGVAHLSGDWRHVCRAEACSNTVMLQLQHPLPATTHRGVSAPRPGREPARDKADIGALGYHPYIRHIHPSV